MHRVLQWTGVAVGGLLALALLAAVVLSIVGGARLTRTRHIAPEPVAILADSAALARGKHLISAVCTGCHGADLTGQPLLQNGLGEIYSANITGLAASYRDDDFVRSIRHAVAPDGHELAIMPADAMIYLSREDLGAVIGYLKTVPRAGRSRKRLAR